MFRDLTTSDDAPSASFATATWLSIAPYSKEDSSARATQFFCLKIKAPCPSALSSKEGSVATAGSQKPGGALIRIVRLSQAQQRSEYPGLSVQVLSRNPEYLAFANHVYGFDRLNHREGSRCSPWALHRT